jgi:hypothetical protein
MKITSPLAVPASSPLSFPAQTPSVTTPTGGAETTPQQSAPLAPSTPLSFGNAVQNRATAELDPNLLSFGQSEGVNDDQAIQDLKNTFVQNGKVGVSRMRDLDAQVDTLLANPEMRAALIERYDLDSDTNRKALMAVGTMESGSNGDMGETMTVTMNRALVQNMMQEITGKNDNISIREVVNQPGQYESASRVNAVLDGGRTHENWDAFQTEAGGLADEIMSGQAHFTEDASDIYFFRTASFGRSTEFTIGRHKFDDTLNNITYAQEALRLAGGINHNR